MLRTLASTATKQEEDHSQRQRQPEKITLSNYFPSGSIYFYSFPAGEDSKFYNAVPPWIEELVAARPLVCAGEQAKVLVFSATSTDEIKNVLQNICGLSLAKPEQIIKLSDSISSDLSGDARNKAVKNNLGGLVKKRNLIMAQPFLDKNLKATFQINPDLTVWLNDKENLPAFVPSQSLPQRTAWFQNGLQFAASEMPAFPCVVKVSSSSAGDGVRVCHGEHSFAKAKNDFRRIANRPIYVEQHIPAKENYCVQFAIPFEKNQDIEIIGQNRQLTSPAGEFLGAAVDLRDANPVLQKIYEVLLETVLPKIRGMGWYGIGGIDVLVDQGGNFYFIDANFRMTATFAYVCQARSGLIQKPVISFTGSFNGSIEQLKNVLFPHATKGHANQILEMLSLTRRQGTYWFNAGMMFDHPETVTQNATDLLRLGVNSQVLANLVQSPHLF